jgi:mannose-1-phosphate guanylyltransferase/mannose-6-phosphate isomerase
MKIKPVIMAGGEGSRLWPLSQQHYPKQFIQMIRNKSLFQMALERNAVFSKPTVITTNSYAELATTQAHEIGIEVNLIIEPIKRNTAPCGIVGSLHTQDMNHDIILLLPSDLYISNQQNYIKAVHAASMNSLSSDKITIFGIAPTKPHTGYGYIRTSKNNINNLYDIDKFIEKPPLSVAKEFLESSNYYWNSGILISKPEIILKAVQTINPDMYTHALNSYKKARIVDNIVLLEKSYHYIVSDSIDFALMEKIHNLSMYKADFEWNDLGGWDALWEIQDKDSIGNATNGDVTLYDTSNSYIHSDGKFTAVLGIKDILVINTPTASLIVHKSRTEDIKQLVQKLTTRHQDIAKPITLDIETKLLNMR